MILFDLKTIKLMKRNKPNNKGRSVVLQRPGQSERHHIDEENDEESIVLDKSSDFSIHELDEEDSEADGNLSTTNFNLKHWLQASVSSFNLLNY